VRQKPKRYRSKDANQPWIVVRRATRKDISAILRNVAEVAKEQVYLGTEVVTPMHRKRQLERLKEAKSLTIVATVGGKVVGSLTLWQSGLKKMKHVRELGMLVIDGYREIGVGRALIDYSLEWAKAQREIEKLVLGVFSSNKRAFHLYQKFGFKEEGLLKRQHILKGKYADEFRMALFI
jgi:RimJ/RimL family protein N-acetyltransferase